MALSTGRSARGRSLSDHDGTACDLRITLRLRLDGAGDKTQRAYGGNRCRANQLMPVHVCTKGPGDFRYSFLILSSANKVSAPIVIV